MKRSFSMITLKQILSQICLGDWFVSLDLRDDYFHIQIAPIIGYFWDSHLKGWLINTRSCRLGCPWLPALLHDAMDAAGNPHTPLPRQLAHFAQSAGSFDIAQDPPPQPLRLPGAQGQLCQGAYCHPANGYRSWVQLSTRCRWQLRSH